MSKAEWRMTEQEKKLRDLWDTLTAKEQRTFTALRVQRTKLKIRNENMPKFGGSVPPPWQKHYDTMSPSDFASYRISGASFNAEKVEAGAAALRKMADDPLAVEVDAKLRRRPPPPVKDRFIKLRTEIYKMGCIDPEDWDVQASPDALRHLAGEMEDHAKEIRKAEAERRRREQREQAAEDKPLSGSPLDVLNLPATATPEQINARFRALCKQLHPDTNKGDDAASGLLRQVTEAMWRLRALGLA